MKLDRMDSPKESNELIYFQNLVPGKPDSPFIDQYKKQCLNDNDNEQRKSLLNEFPPILSFFEKQKKKFYEEQAKMCAFCCGGMLASNDLLSNDVSLKPSDNYMYSNGSGKLYEGSAAQIKGQMQDDIRQAPFGSSEQENKMAEMKQFDDIVSQRGENNAATTPKESAAMEASQSPSPLKTNLKPLGEKD